MFGITPYYNAHFSNLLVFLEDWGIEGLHPRRPDETCYLPDLGFEHIVFGITPYYNDHFSNLLVFMEDWGIEGPSPPSARRNIELTGAWI